MLRYLARNVLSTGALHALTAVAPTSGIYTSQGWTVGTNAAPKYCVFRPDTTQAAATFSATEPTAFSQYGFRSVDPLTGVFASDVWQLAVKVKSGASYYTQTGYIKFRLWRSAAANGSGATEITDGWQASSLISFTASSQYQSKTIATTVLPEISLAGEYLFVELEWAVQGAGPSSSAVVYFAANESAELLTTPTFTPPIISGGAVAGGEVPVGMHVSEITSGGAVAGCEVPATKHVREYVSGGAVAGGVVDYDVSPMRVAGLVFVPEPVRPDKLRFFVQ